VPQYQPRCRQYSHFCCGGRFQRRWQSLILQWRISFLITSRSCEARARAASVPETNFAVGNSPVSVAVADFNGDGKLDLAAANPGPDAVAIFLNNGATCNTQTSLSISGRISDSRNNALADVAVTLSGPITRVTQSDINGNYSFANLVPGGNYSVTLQSTYFVFCPVTSRFLQPGEQSGG